MPWVLWRLERKPGKLWRPEMEPWSRWTPEMKPWKLEEAKMDHLRSTKLIAKMDTEKDPEIKPKRDPTEITKV